MNLIKDSGFEEIRPGVSLGNVENSGTVVGLKPAGKKDSVLTQGKNENAQTKETLHEKAQTSIADLHNRYSQELRDQYDYSIGRLRDERDEALRENWILHQQAKANLPEKLAAAGINGGAAETTIAGIDAEYQGGRNDIRENYSEETAKTSEDFLKNAAENNKNYSDMWMDYLLSLAQMEKEHEYDMDLARYK